MIDWVQANILYILLAIGVVFSIAWVLNFQKELRIKWYAAIFVCILIAAVGVFSAKLFAVIEGWIADSAPGNMSIYGAIFFTPLVCILGALVFRRPVKTTMDILTIPIVILAALARANCLFNGCCLGLEIPGTVMRYPTRGLELVFDIILIIVLIRLTAKKRFIGTNYPIYLLSYGIFRFIIQWFREPGFMVGPLTLSHIWSILSILIGLGFILSLNKKAQRQKKNRPKKRNSRTIDDLD